MKRLISFFVIVSATLPIFLAAQLSAAAEPTNAEEAAAKKAAADKIVAEEYAALVAALPPDQQAWEQILQENLGGFYLPIHMRQKVQGQPNAWDFIQDDPALPRVLLIGDSVSRGYTQATRKALAGKANVHRAPANCGPTATGVKKLDVWLGDGAWDLIHFNFGIHDRKTPIADYTSRLEQLVEGMAKTGARLVWATTTPIPGDSSKKQRAASIVERNRAAARVMRKHGVAVDDLFTAVTPHLAAMQKPNDVHFNGDGYDFLGAQVAASIEANLSLTKVVIAIAEPGYHTEKTLPDLAEKIWTGPRGYDVTVIRGDPAKHDLAGLDIVLPGADVLVLSIRRQALPKAQLQAIRDHLAAGKPLLAIRTSSHGLTAKGKGPAGHPEWDAFDTEVLGAGYKTHAGHDLVATFTAAPGSADDPILAGVKLPFSSGGGIYFSTAFASTTRPLLAGTLEGHDPEPVAWTNTYGTAKAKIFYTSLGQEEEFASPSFQKLLGNAMEWLRE